VARRYCLATLFLFIAVAASSCGTQSLFTTPFEHAHSLATQAGFKPIALKTQHFDLKAFIKPSANPDYGITIYLEGDGRPWASSFRPPRDPSPLDPLGLRLATVASMAPIAYIARACQFLDAKALESCPSRYWTYARFAPEVVNATSLAVDQLKTRTNSNRVHLVGFSGGGVIAALVAAQRKDVASLITIAAPLDLRVWTEHHGITPMYGSLQPTDFVETLHKIPQIHFVGTNDAVSPSLVQQSFLTKLGQPTTARIVAIEGYNHQCCWAENWSKLLNNHQLLMNLDD
jgi:hypothetical protein